MKKTNILIGVLLVLGFSAYLLQKKQSKPGLESLRNERSFAVAEVSDVNKIKLEYREGKQHVFEKVDGIWMLNDSIRVFKPTMNSLLEVIQKLEVNYTPSKSALPFAREVMEEIGIEVSIFDKDEQIIKAYTIGGVTADEKGTYAIVKGYDDPFVVSMPFIDVSIRGRFEVSPEKWRDRYIFREAWDQIKHVSVVYPRERDASFFLKKEDGKYWVGSIGMEGEGPSKEITKGRAEAYLMHFEKVGCEAFSNQYHKKDSIMSLIPFCHISLQKDNGAFKTLDLYPINDMTGYVDLSEEYLNKNNFFRFFGVTEEEDFILIQKYTIGKALQSYQSFLD